MNISHQMAQQFIHKGLHEPLGKEELALLDVHLVGCTECVDYQSRLARLEISLHRALPAHQTQRSFSHAEINQRLLEIQPAIRRKKVSQRIGFISRQFSLAAVAAILVFGLIYIINNLRPGIVPSAALTNTPVVIVQPVPEEPTPTPLPNEPLPASQILPGSMVWSPNGDWLAYTIFPTSQILLVDPQKGETIEISSISVPNHATLQTAWSPQGDRLVVYGAWGSDLPRLTGIWSVEITSEGPNPAQELVPPHPANSQVQQNEGIILSVDWQADGMRLAYSYNAEAWIYDFESGESRQVTQVTKEPLPRQGGSEVFDGVQEVFLSPDGSQLALGLTCNCPSPWSGVGVVDLGSGETKLLVDGGRPSGWTPDGDRITLQNVTGDWSGGYTYDTYSADPESGDLINLTCSNPDFDPLVASWDAYQEAPFQAFGLTWGPEGKYLYQTRDYRQNETGEPTMGFIVRADEDTVVEERFGSEEVWYIAPSLLADGQVAYLEAIPNTAGSGYATTYQVDKVVAGDVIIPFRAAPHFVSEAAWAQDGKWVALAIATGPEKPTDQVQIISLTITDP